MIRTSTALCVIAAVASGLFLYSEKRQALMIDREIGGLLRATADLRTRTALLRAEWAALLEPDRLQAMVSEHLALQPMTPAQFVQLDELGAHLPAPDTSSASTGPDDDEPAPAPQIMAGSTGQSVSAPASSPAQPEAASASGILASAVLPHHARHSPAAVSPGIVQAAAVPAGPKPAGRYLADRHGLATHRLADAGGQDRAFAGPKPVTANTYRAMAQTMPGASRPTQGETVQAASRPSVASALGNHVALSPPVPYGQ